MVVTSAGCDYIRHLLSQVGIELVVHANPGRFVPEVDHILANDPRLKECFQN